MKEKIYTIPVNDGFNVDSECPVCVMVEELEKDTIDFAMGPSYMEDDVRGETSRLGFCPKHVKDLYAHQNRLGLALIMQSHMAKVVKEVEKGKGVLSKISKPSIFKKAKANLDKGSTYLYQIQSSCYVCDKVERIFEKYIETLFYLYGREEEFRKKFDSCKGFCTGHYQLLSEKAKTSRYLNDSQRLSFTKRLDELYIDNMKRVIDDLEWFINKFDYRYVNEPWKDAKDAPQRAIRKMNSIDVK